MFRQRHRTHFNIPASSSQTPGFSCQLVDRVKQLKGAERFYEISIGTGCLSGFEIALLTTRR
jgi:hypothetical protein